MNIHFKKILKMSLYLIIPLITVWICRGFKIAQGEKNEEVIFGIMLGIVLNFICSIVFVLIGKYKNKTR